MIPQIKISTGLRTRLEPVSKDYSIEEGLQARVKDPLWMLGRQWQLGEFRAQNSGSPVRADVKVVEEPVNQLKRQDTNATYEPLDLSNPLEMKVEAEPNAQFVATGQDEPIHPAGSESSALATPGIPMHEMIGWDSRRLEYNFKMKGPHIELGAKAYDGNHLDWYSFDLMGESMSMDKPEGNTVDLAAVPAHVSYKGMPLARWWGIENGRVDFGNLTRTHLNFLTMLLVEFGLLYSNDWFYFPLKQKVGTARKIVLLQVTDSFGIVETVNPVHDPGVPPLRWDLFSLSASENASTPVQTPPSSGSVFYMPNTTIGGGLEGDPIEEVSFLRDELANLAWGVEHRYYDDKHECSVERHDEGPHANVERAEPQLYWDQIAQKLVPQSRVTGSGEPGKNYIGPLATNAKLYWDNARLRLVPEGRLPPEGERGEEFTGPFTMHEIATYDLISHVPPYWIPYVPRPVKSGNGRINLRRGKTLENADGSTQYKGHLLGESQWLDEEVISRAGVMVKRNWQLARGSDGEYFLWLGRKKGQDFKRRSSGLRFDFLRRRA